MTKTTHGPEEPLSEVARESAANNRKAFAPAELAERQDIVDADSISPAGMACKIVEKLVDNNTKVVHSRMQSCVDDLSEFAGALDAANERLTKATANFREITEGVVVEVRGVRTSLATEVDLTLKRVRDVQGLIEEIEPGLKTMAALVELGERLTTLYGPDAMSRLADTLLGAVVAAEESKS